MINFKSVLVQNFLSIGKDPVKINFREGLNIITGQNLDKERSNGAGKSSILTEPVFFALYGKTLRGLNKSDVVNKKTKKDTKIELEFSKDGKEYKIERCVKPSTLTLYVDGKDVSRDSIGNTQSDIEKVIGTSEDVIKNCVIMGINQTVPFMAQSKVDKRKFIEGIFDMNVFSEMLKQARKDYNIAAKLLTSLQSQESEKKRNFEIYKEQSEKFEDNKNRKIENIKQQILNKNKEKEVLSKKIVDIDSDYLKKLEEDRSKLVLKLDDIRENSLQSEKDAFSEANITINNLKKQIDGVFTSGICPTCKREMSVHDQKHANEHIDNLQGEVVTLIEKKEEHERNIKKINDVILVIIKKIEVIDQNISSYKQNQTKNEITQSKINDYTSMIKNMIVEVKNIKNETNDLDAIVKKVQVELSNVSKEIEETTKETEILDQIKFICGENGVKSYIVNKLLGIFNSRINFYLDKLNANCVLMFDEFFEEKIINDKKQECSYFNFSSGERRNIDIAIMFAFMDLQKLQGKFDTNMLAFDELCDSSLDGDGIQFVLDILLDKCNNEGKSIYLITHRKELQQQATGEVIKVIKENGISRIER